MQEANGKRFELYLGGDKEQLMGWVQVHNGVIVIDYKDEYRYTTNSGNYLILPLGDALKLEFYGAYDRSKHKMPY